MTNIRVKRVYEPAQADDGLRVLVDRLWPRGVSKERAAIDHWVRDVAPSDDLRRWFGHDPQKWSEFRRRYFAELGERPEALAGLRTLLAGRAQATLLYSAHDETHNNAQALAEYLRKR